jgi:hypothetical protein
MLSAEDSGRYTAQRLQHHTAHDDQRDAEVNNQSATSSSVAGTRNQWGGIKRDSVWQNQNYQNHPFFLNHQMVAPVAARVIEMAVRYPCFHSNSGIP